MRARWIVSLLLAGAMTPALAEKRVALVIGNAAYAQVGALANSGADAAMVADALTTDGFEVTLLRDAARTDMLRAFKTFSDKVEESDWALVYYAGHGIEIGGVNYLLPTDAQMRDDRDAQDEAISLSRVLDMVESAKKMRIVILDACRNNPFASTMKRSVKVRAVERGLAPVEPVSGTLVVYAAAAGQVAEDGADGHSPFAAALVKRITEPGLEVSRLFNVVAADVLSATARHQLPFQYGSNPTREEFYFKPPTSPRAEKPPALAGFWGALKSSTETATLKAFLDNLPPDDALRAEVQARIAEVGATKAAANPEVAALMPTRAKVAPEVPEPTECDRLAADPFDPDLPKGFPFVTRTRIKAEPAIAACRAALEASPDDRRLTYQLGLALHRAKQFEAAKFAYDRAAALGSPAAVAALGVLYAEGIGVEQNFKTAREHLEKAAAAGSPTGMSALIDVYDKGKGVAADPNAARKWERAVLAWTENAAREGNSEAMVQIGLAYQFGWGVPVDYDVARSWYEKATATNNPTGLFWLANLYANGTGVPADYERALGMFKKAASAGVVDALNSIGSMHESGRGVPLSEADARNWYEMAAEGGSAIAMYNLGRLYYMGAGVPKSRDMARGWYEKALAGGYEDASKALQQLNTPIQ